MREGKGLDARGRTPDESTRNPEENDGGGAGAFARIVL